MSVNIPHKPPFILRYPKLNIINHKYSAKANFAFIIPLIIFINCSPTMVQKKIKKIEYYNFSGLVNYAKATEISQTKAGLNKVEYFDMQNNLIREHGFDRDMNEDNIIEAKFDNDNNIIEKQTFKNFPNQPGKKTYLSKYIYKAGLLVETHWYYGTLDTLGFFAKTIIAYNNKNKKTREEYTEYNDNANKETRIYKWQDDYSYIEDRINKEGILEERHYIKLNNEGKEVQHNMNFEPSSINDNSFPIHLDWSFDRFGNELTRTKKINGNVVETTEYKYQYENSVWTYRVFYANNEALWTQIRKIEYY